MRTSKGCWMLIERCIEVCETRKKYKVRICCVNTKERNPKLLPIGDGFGFLFVFEENIFLGDLS